MYPQPPQDSTLIPVYNNDDREKQEQEISSWLKALADRREDPESNLDNNINIFKTMVLNHQQYFVLQDQHKNKYYDNKSFLEFVYGELLGFTNLLSKNFSTNLETCLGNQDAIADIRKHFDQKINFAQQSVIFIESLLPNQQSVITHQQLPVSLIPVGGQLSQQDGFGEVPSSPRADQEQASLSSFPPPLGLDKGLDNIPINADPGDTEPRAIEISQSPIPRETPITEYKSPEYQLSPVQQVIRFFEGLSTNTLGLSKTPSSPHIGPRAHNTGPEREIT